MKIHSKEDYCKAKCRDGTNCLNSSKYGAFCWKHYTKDKLRDF